MQKATILSITIILFFSGTIFAQKVPDNIIALYEKVYTKDDYIIEKKILPAFDRAHPNQMYFFNQCYPGKSILIYAIMAERPKSWKFKASVGNTELKKIRELKEIDLLGKTYYTDCIAVSFPASMHDQSDKCMNIVAYDLDNIDLPVYLIIFSKK